MANQQLITYIKQQLQLGESETPIKNSLRSVGWSDADITEAFKSASPSPAPAITSPATPFAAQTAPKTSATAEPKRIDLNAFAPQSAPSISRATASPATVSFTAQKPVEATFSPGASVQSSVAGMATESKKSSWVSTVLMGIVIVALAGLSGLLYKNNSELKAKVTEFNNQISALTGSVSNSGQNTAELNQRIAKLESDFKDVDSQLALFLPLKTSTSTVNSTSSPTSTPIIVTTVTPLTLSGSLGGGGKSNYVLTTSRNISVNIKNSKDAKVDALLKPLVGSPVELTGTPTSGAREISVTHINGAPIQ